LQAFDFFATFADFLAIFAVKDLPGLQQDQHRNRKVR
jgi:hypothetical protein